MGKTLDRKKGPSKKVLYNKINRWWFIWNENTAAPISNCNVIHFWVSCLQTNTKKGKSTFLGSQYVYPKRICLHSQKTADREQFMDTADTISRTIQVPPVCSHGSVTPATKEVPNLNDADIHNLVYVSKDIIMKTTKEKID